MAVGVQDVQAVMRRGEYARNLCVLCAFAFFAFNTGSNERAAV